MHARRLHTASILMLCIALVLMVSACGGNTTADVPATTPADTQDDTVTRPPNDQEDEQPAVDSSAHGADDDDTTTTDTEEEDATERDDDTTSPPDEDEAATDGAPDEQGDGRERNEPGGFAFTPIEGWDVQSLELFDGGATILMPADTDIDNPEAGINIFAGPVSSADVFLGNVDADGSLEEWFEVFAQDVEADGSASLSEPQPVDIGGVDGVMADISSSEEDLGEMKGRVVIARVDSDRLFQMIGFGTVEHWDEAQFDGLLESISFFEPVLPEQPQVPQLDLDQLAPGGTDAVTPSESISPTEQLP